ncbi:hypothetical protein [Vibrio sp. T11.5]|uniref:hypothetical protein n=1 Tax=Vibrio sp. T11.5 TaxID=2998836 RepID=UPI0022CD58F2|nr:hypothetical protein [Vibrio sp. T11.5]MDA0120789.1 hypothetical protein [Vibrio sp. T11.5]
MKTISGLVEPSILSRFPSGFPEKIGYTGYVSNCVGLEGVLACAALFSPEFVEYDGAIFLNSNIENNVRNISTRFGSSKKEVEQYNNLVCLSEFFLLAEDEACEDDELMKTFAETLIYYWKARLEFVYPDKSFEFLLEEKLFDEDGLCLTFFEI